MGPFGKGMLNSNGSELLELSNRNKLILTNTLFQHKLSHTTTWEAPFRNYTHWDGTARRNPIRNQIDYILVRCDHRYLVMNSRSYGGIYTHTHRPQTSKNDPSAAELWPKTRQSKTHKLLQTKIPYNQSSVCLLSGDAHDGS